MPGILQAVRDSSVQEIEAGGFTWRIRKVCSADLARVGYAWLSMATPDDGKPDMDLSNALKRASEDKLVQLAALKDAIIAAGLLAIGHDGQWDECRVTLKQSEENAQQGVIWIGSLPAEVDNELFSAIMSLSTDGGAAAERLASFRGKSRDANSVGQPVAEVRSAAT